MQYNPVETFLQEADDLLAEIEQSALSLGAGDASEETIHHLFRAFHTIKGSGAMCGFDKVGAFTHHVESLLDQVRQGSVPVSPALADVLLKARDHIRILLAGDQTVPPSGGEALIAEIEGLARMPAQKEATPVTVPGASSDASEEEKSWRICFHPNPLLFTTGGSPVAIARELRRLGQCEITANVEEVPFLDAIQPDHCYVSWTITIFTGADLNAIRDVFLFVEDDSRVEIEPVAIETQPRTTEKAVAPTPRSDAPEPGPAIGRGSTVRVPSQRLDRLVNLVGELVMNQSRLAQAASKGGSPEFANPVQELERLVEELRENVLGIRMLPIGTLFGRFRRLVHDLSAELGKEVDLVTEGAETELDKSILDQLGEPLVHCLRNAVDHAVETPAERLSKGKPARATIRLSAVHTGSDVVVSIRDDGRGIDRAAVRQKAIDKQLVPASAALSDKEVFNLILLPGFSTARQLTSVSGRGVGMDAVKRQIDALRGSLSITSKEGAGTCVSMTLPLTLAIIEGLLVAVGPDRFIVPLAAVTENVELLQSQRSRNNGRNVIAVRGELVPYIDLRCAFGIECPRLPIEKVVIVEHEEHRVGLVVDRVLGTHQTVIQSLGRFLRSIEVVSGATIMGDGSVALIMDVAAIVRFVDRNGSSGLASSNPQFLRGTA